MNMWKTLTISQDFINKHEQLSDRLSCPSHPVGIYNRYLLYLCFSSFLSYLSPNQEILTNFCSKYKNQYYLSTL